MALEQEVEQPLPTQNPKSQLGCQRCVGLLYAGFKLRKEQIGGVSAFCGNAPQDIKRNLPRNGNCHVLSLIEGQT